jgi:hypothetical protein
MELSLNRQARGITPDPTFVPERAGREGDSQSLPTKNDEVDSQSVAVAMILRRRQLGVKRYGTALQPNNGRDSLWDAVEEALDMFTYLLNYWREQHPGEETPDAVQEG